MPAIAAGIEQRLQREPLTGRIVAMLAILTGVLYVAGLNYPLVFGDFAVLGAAKLQAYARAWPALGGDWLARASFGWSGYLFGAYWSGHRLVNVGLHLAAAALGFALFRRILAGAGAGGGAHAVTGWIAFLAAGLLAVHPIAVYTVAYLSARAALLAGVCALTALWATARCLQSDARLGAAGVPLAMLAALACGPGALGIPLAAALLVLTLPAASPRHRRRAWTGAALAGLIAIAYALWWAYAAPADPASGSAYGNALAAACVRLLRYLGFWWVPLTAYTAIDMPEPALAGLPAVLAVAGVVLLLALLAWLLVRKHSGPVRAAAIGAGCTLALYLPQLLWPRLAAPFALPASYAFMLPALLLPACLAALLPLRAGWALGACALLAWLAVAADTLQTFSTHIALWDDAVRRVERTGRAPQDARVYINRATLHRSQGHTLAALADFDTALGLQPDSPRALRGRAQAYVDEKRYGEALRDLDRLLELEPEQAITHADRGMVLMQAGRYNEAGFAFDRAVAKGVKEPRVYLNRGLARLHQGGLSSAPAALIDIERAIALDPNYALAYYNRAMVFEQSANAGIRLRDALSPELMRAVASQNLDRACELGHAGACERQRAKAEQLVPGEEAPLGVKPEALREKGLPAR